MSGHVEGCGAGGHYNVLKPVPQPPLEPELDFEEASGTKISGGTMPCLKVSIDPGGRGAGPGGEEQPPW